MRSTLLSSVVLVGIGAVIGISSFGCTETECGPGTINRAGQCEPADETVGVAKCGPSTELRGDQCVPKLPPTKCDPTTTQPDVDAQGVTTCIGTGGGGCSAPLACPTPAAGKQSICGQLYNFADNTPFAAPGATGARCTGAAATDGPCALAISAINPYPQMIPLVTGEIYIDDCGRYRVPDIVSTGTSVVLNIDDAAASGKNAPGVTVLTHVGVKTAPDSITKDFEAWIVKDTTVKKWTDTATDLSLTYGLYAGIFRAHVCGPGAGECTRNRFENQANAKFGGPVVQLGTQYFFAAEPKHENLQVGATETTSNGTALTKIAIGPVVGLTGSGGIVNNTLCKWSQANAIQFENSVFFQVYRPTDQPSQTCTQ